MTLSLCNQLDDRRRQRPDAFAYVIDGVGRSNEVSIDHVFRIANGLIAAGIGKGDRIAVLSRNSIECAEVMTGILCSGASMVPVPSTATPEAQQWDGWGTALKPALEPITVARKPVAEKSIAENVLKYGTGAINIDASLVETNPEVDDPRLGGNGSWSTDNMAKNAYGDYEGGQHSSHSSGRFPANLIHDGSDEVVELAGDSARFFYCAKASKKDRDEGLDHMEEQQFVQWQTGNGASGKPSSMSEGRDTKRKNTHPTVKPTDLMKYLVRMVTPKGGVVLDPFMGSGSTGKACKLEGFDFIGIEMDEEYFLLAKSRIDGIMVESTLEDFFK